MVSKVKSPSCTLCPRGSKASPASLFGECFVLIPCQINQDGQWISSTWNLFCGQCFSNIIHAYIHKYKDRSDNNFTVTPLSRIDFQNLFLNIPLTIFKTENTYKIEFKNY